MLCSCDIDNVNNNLPSNEKQLLLKVIVSISDISIIVLERVLNCVCVF